MTDSSQRPQDHDAERRIASTLIDFPPLWDQMAGLSTSYFSDSQAKQIIITMAKLKNAGRQWLRTDFPHVTDTAGNFIQPESATLFPELVKRVRDAGFLENAQKLSEAIGRAVVKRDVEATRKALDPLRIPDYALADGRTPGTWEQQAAIVPQISWLWRPWLPMGMLSMCVGASEIGKSALSMMMARSVIGGSSWPDGTEGPAGGLVVWYDTENAEAINHERARKWGVRLDMVLVPQLNHDPLSDVDLMEADGWAAFEMAVRTQGVRLVIVDSLGGAWLDENDARVKTLVKRLGALARDAQVAILIVHHPRKLHLGEHDILTLDRVRGHSGIVQFARVIWALEKPDPGIDVVRCKVIKSNLGSKPESFGFEFNEGGLTWEEAPEEIKQETQADKAADLLKALLKDGPRPAQDIYDEGNGAGLSQMALKRAKKVLRIVSVRKADRWIWSLPTREPYIPEDE